MVEYACLVGCIGLACVGVFELVEVSIGEEGLLGYAVCRIEHVFDEEQECGVPDDRTGPPDIGSVDGAGRDQAEASDAASLGTQLATLFENPDRDHESSFSGNDYDVAQANVALSDATGVASAQPTETSTTNHARHGPGHATGSSGSSVRSSQPRIVTTEPKANGFDPARGSQAANDNRTEQERAQRKPARSPGTGKAIVAGGGGLVMGGAAVNYVKANSARSILYLQLDEQNALELNYQPSSKELRERAEQSQALGPSWRFDEYLDLGKITNDLLEWIWPQPAEIRLATRVDGYPNHEFVEVFDEGGSRVARRSDGTVVATQANGQEEWTLHLHEALPEELAWMVLDVPGIVGDAEVLGHVNPPQRAQVLGHEYVEIDGRGYLLDRTAGLLTPYTGSDSAPTDSRATQMVASEGTGQASAGNGSDEEEDEREDASAQEAALKQRVEELRERGALTPHRSPSGEATEARAELGSAPEGEASDGEAPRGLAGLVAGIDALEMKAQRLREERERLDELDASLGWDEAMIRSTEWTDPEAKKNRLEAIAQQKEALVQQEEALVQQEEALVQEVVDLLSSHGIESWLVRLSNGRLGAGAGNSWIIDPRQSTYLGVTDLHPMLLYHYTRAVGRPAVPSGEQTYRINLAFLSRLVGAVTRAEALPYRLKALKELHADAKILLDDVNEYAASSGGKRGRVTQPAHKERLMALANAAAATLSQIGFKASVELGGEDSRPMVAIGHLYIDLLQVDEKRSGSGPRVSKRLQALNEGNLRFLLQEAEDLVEEEEDGLVGGSGESPLTLNLEDLRKVLSPAKPITVMLSGGGAAGVDFLGQVAATVDGFVARREPNSLRGEARRRLYASLPGPVLTEKDALTLFWSLHPRFKDSSAVLLPIVTDLLTDFSEQVGPYVTVLLSESPEASRTPWYRLKAKGWTGGVALAPQATVASGATVRTVFHDWKEIAKSLRRAIKSPQDFIKSPRKLFELHWPRDTHYGFNLIYVGGFAYDPLLDGAHTLYVAFPHIGGVGIGTKGTFFLFRVEEGEALAAAWGFAVQFPLLGALTPDDVERWIARNAWEVRRGSINLQRWTTDKASDMRRLASDYILYGGLPKDLGLDESFWFRDSDQLSKDVAAEKERLRELQRRSGPE